MTREQMKELWERQRSFCEEQIQSIKAQLKALEHERDYAQKRLEALRKKSA